MEAAVLYSCILGPTQPRQRKRRREGVENSLPQAAWAWPELIQKSASGLGKKNGPIPQNGPQLMSLHFINQENKTKMGPPEFFDQQAKKTKYCPGHRAAFPAFASVVQF